MPLSTQTKTSVAVGFLAILAGLVGGLIFYPGLSASGGRRMAIHWQADGGDVPPDGTIVCVLQTGVGLASALPVFGLDAGAGAPYGYALCRACAVQLDAGILDPTLPSGISPLEVTQEEVDFDGGAQFWCVLQGEPEWPCACSTGPGCLGIDGGAAPTGVTLAAGAWSGSCFPKACIELSGFPSTPSECGAQ